MIVVLAAVMIAHVLTAARVKIHAPTAGRQLICQPQMKMVEPQTWTFQPTLLSHHLIVPDAVIRLLLVQSLAVNLGLNPLVALALRVMLLASQILALTRASSGECHRWEAPRLNVLATLEKESFFHKWP